MEPNQLTNRSDGSRTETLTIVTAKYGVRYVCRWEARKDEKEGVGIPKTHWY